MTDQLTAAIAEVNHELNRIGRWKFSEVHDLPEGKAADAVDCILEAVASGALIPATDAKLAVAEALRGATGIVREIMADSLNVPICHDELVGTLSASILALADTYALAQVQALRAETEQANAMLLDEARVSLERLHRAVIAEAKLAALVEGQERVQHVKRGSTYRVLARGRLQTDTPLTDYAEVVVYQGEADSLVWVRLIEEFDDGRFVTLAAAKEEA